MSYNENIVNSNTAFGSGEYETALKYAEAAIKDNPKEAEGYYAAGKACMSMDTPENSVSYFKKAVDIDKKNGNGYFLLGYAQAMNGNSVEALKSLTKALENNCDEILKGQIYKMISMVNTEKSDFKNALLNIEQAEQYIGLDYELLQQKAACYASLEDYHKALFTLNQMKLLKPDNYMAYSLAFNIFMDLNIYDEAKAELKRAEEFANLDMTYYNDRVNYTLMHDIDKDTAENLPKRYKDTLKEIENALIKGKPDAEQVFDMYLRAAQLYLSLEQPDESIMCLDAAGDPVFSYNQKFSILQDKSKDILTESVPDNMTPEDEEELMQEKWDNGEFEELSEKIEDALYDIDDDDPEKITEEMQKYLSPLDSVKKEDEPDTPYVLDDSFEMDQMQTDMRNGLYISAYEMKNDYDNMLHKARELQASNISENQYSGIYYELKVGKYKNDENWKKKYNDRINFWTKKMLENPMDYLSAAYRIRSYIDIGDFKNAEQVCSCVPTDMKESLMKEIKDAKGGGDDGNTSE